MKLLAALIAAAALLWSASANAACSDTPPGPVSTFGLTYEVFCDGPFSLTTIDVNDTATLTNQAGSCTDPGGCKWYTNANFPNTAIGRQCPGLGPTANNGFGAGVCPATAGTYANTISISGGVLTLQRQTAYSGSRVDLSTCKANGSSGQFGFKVSPPFYIEFSATYGAGLDGAAPDGAEAAIWGVSTNYMLNGQQTVQAIELDFAEGPYGKHINDIYSSGGAGQIEYFTKLPDGGSGSVNGTLIIPQVLNPNGDSGASGLVRSYSNGSLLANSTLTFGRTVTPKFNGGNAGTDLQLGSGAHAYDDLTGGYQTLNNDSFCIWMGSGQGQALTVNWIRVWTLPPSPGGRSIVRH